MDTATALQTPEILDLIQVATAPVPIDQFRLLPDCGQCLYYSNRPSTPYWNGRARNHVISDHADLVIVSSD